jgi:hypothetical protein
MVGVPKRIDSIKVTLIAVNWELHETPTVAHCGSAGASLASICMLIWARPA